MKQSREPSHRRYCLGEDLWERRGSWDSEVRGLESGALEKGAGSEWLMIRGRVAWECCVVTLIDFEVLRRTVLTVGPVDFGTSYA